MSLAEMYKLFRPDLEHPRLDDMVGVLPMLHSMPIPFIEPVDVSNAVCLLASDESGYFTGLRMTVEAGAPLKI